jgi:hypothetical protein
LGDHVRLEEDSLEEYIVLLERLDDLGKNSLGDLSTNLDGVVAVSKDLRLDNGSKTVLLADHSVSSKGVSGLKYRELRGATTSNLEHGAPLGESGSSFVVLLASLTKTVKTSGETKS